MRYVKRWIDCSEYDFLEVTIYDDEDKEELSKYNLEKYVLISISDIMFLKEFKQIEKLIITSGLPPKGMGAILAKMTSLKSLKIDYIEDSPGTDWCIDISTFPKLEYVFSRSSYNFCGISATLKTLVVMEWYQSDLTLLNNCSIDSLRICGGKLKTLQGIGNTPVKILSLSNLKNLKDISEAKTIPIKMLEIESCNQISSLEDFKSDTLEYLMIYGKNRIKTGKFFEKFKKLKRVILDIIIEDGDLSGLDSLEKAVIMTDKRNYNRKDEELPKSSQDYTIKDIPMWRYVYSDRKL